jgi:hypothetical protein
MKLLSKMKGCAKFDRILYLKYKLNYTYLSEKIQDYRYQWMEYVERIDSSRIPTAKMHYTTKKRKY